MSTLSEHHKKLNERGEGKCSVPMWCGGLPAGFCDQPAYSNHKGANWAYLFSVGGLGCVIGLRAGKGLRIVLSGII